MPQVHIVLDSTAHVPSAMLAVNGNLHVVPLMVTLGQQQWPEDEIANADLFVRIRESGLFSKTSQPAPGDFIQLFQSITETGGELVVITLSGGLSGTCRGAESAAEMVNSGKVWVVDSGTTAIGMVKMAEQGLAMARDGYSGAQIAAQIAAMAQATHTLFVPATLEYLYKGGRIGGAAALFGSILHIHPILYLYGGRVAVLDKVRTWSKAVSRIVAEVKQHNKPVYIGVVHIEAPEEAEKLRLQLADCYPGVPVHISTGGAVLASHLGPGLVGVIWQDQLTAQP